MRFAHAVLATLTARARLAPTLRGLRLGRAARRTTTLGACTLALLVWRPTLHDWTPEPGARAPRISVTVRLAGAHGMVTLAIDLGSVARLAPLP
jgi:hypothetical protein